MNQEWLVKNVLDHLDSVPDAPGDDRAYLSFSQAQRIVDETIDELGAHGDETEYTYIKGHRKRLAHSLTMIPKARGDDESCLDIGCYGYMLLWAKEHLGYARVMGIEWHPESQKKIITRTLLRADRPAKIKSHNFDITEPNWPIEGHFDTILFFEVLEHINEDPMGVMERIHARLKPSGTLVMSVPNAISYKAFKEFLVGMPPWTYWFYEPDLSHEPRHCFEYTPIVFKSLIKASGLKENAFRTIYAYSTPENEAQTIEIARSFGIQGESFGETMIVNASKVSDSIALRHPDVLYSPEGYYKNIYPQLQSRLRKAVAHFHAALEAEANAIPAKAPALVGGGIEQLEEDTTLLRAQINDLLYTCDTQLQSQEELQAIITSIESDQEQAADELRRTKALAQVLGREKSELESRVEELLFACDCYLRRESELVAETDASELKRQAAEGAREAAGIEARQTRIWAEDLSKQNADLRAQVDELLFACDCYLQQINDPGRCAQVVRERRMRSVLGMAKSAARKTPVLRTVLRPVYRSMKKFIKRRI